MILFIVVVLYCIGIVKIVQALKTLEILENELRKEEDDGK